MVGLLRFIGLVNAAVWFGGLVFFTLVVALYGASVPAVCVDAADGAVWDWAAGRFCTAAENGEAAPAKVRNAIDAGGAAAGGSLVWDSAWNRNGSKSVRHGGSFGVSLACSQAGEYDEVRERDALPDLIPARNKNPLWGSEMLGNGRGKAGLTNRSAYMSFKGIGVKRANGTR